MSAWGDVRAVKAIDVECPTCLALPGEDCRTDRWSRGKRPVKLLDPERISKALAWRDSGELEITITEPETRCRVCTFANGRVKRCDRCRCEKFGCPAVKTSASRYCVNHAGLGVSSRGPAPKIAGEKLTLLKRLRADGMTQKQCAIELEVSVATIYKAIKSL